MKELLRKIDSMLELKIILYLDEINEPTNIYVLAKKFNTSGHRIKKNILKMERKGMVHCEKENGYKIFLLKSEQVFRSLGTKDKALHNDVGDYVVDINKFNEYNKNNKDLYRQILIENRLINLDIDLYYIDINNFSLVNSSLYLNEKGFNKTVVWITSYLLGDKKRNDKSWFPKQISVAKQLLKKYRLDQIIAGIDYYKIIEPYDGRGITTLLLLLNRPRMIEALNYYKSKVKIEVEFAKFEPKKKLTEDDILEMYLGENNEE